MSFLPEKRSPSRSTYTHTHTYACTRRHTHSSCLHTHAHTHTRSSSLLLLPGQREVPIGSEAILPHRPVLILGTGAPAAAAPADKHGGRAEGRAGPGSAGGEARGGHEELPRQVPGELGPPRVWGESLSLAPWKSQPEGSMALSRGAQTKGGDAALPRELRFPHFDGVCSECWASQVGLVVKNPAAMQETQRHRFDAWVGNIP